MTFIRRWLINLIVDADLEAMKSRDEMIDAELASLRGTGGQENVDRYTQLRDWRYW